MINSWDFENMENLINFEQNNKYILLLNHYNIDYNSLNQKIKITFNKSIDYNPTVFGVSLKKRQYGNFNIQISPQKLFKFWFSNDVLIQTPFSSNWYSFLTTKNCFTYLPPFNFDMVLNVSSEEQFQELSVYFSKSFSYAQHKLTMRSTMQDVFNFLQQLISKFLFGMFFTLEIEDFSSATVIEDSNAKFFDGNYEFRFKIITINKTCELIFFATNVLTITELLYKIDLHFKQTFDFEQHKIMRYSTEKDVYDFILQEIYKITHKNEVFELLLANYEPTKQIDLMWLVSENEIQISFQFKKYNLNRNFQFKAKNLLTNGQLLNNIKVYFNQIFPFEQHRLTAYNTYNDTINVAKTLIAKFVGEKIKFVIELNKSKKQVFLNEKIKSNSELVANGDYISLVMNLVDENSDFLIVDINELTYNEDEIKITTVDADKSIVALEDNPPSFKGLYFDFKFSHTEFTKENLDNFFSQEFDLNLNSMDTYETVLDRLKRKLNIDLPNIYNKVSNLKYSLNHINDDIILKFSHNKPQNLNFIETGRLEFDIQCIFEAQQCNYLLVLKNVTLHYQHLVISIKYFFKQEYDWNIIVKNTGQEILELARENLSYFLGTKYQEKVSIDLKYPTSYKLKSKLGNDTWIVKIAIDGVMLDNSENEIAIRLKNIKANHKIINNKILVFFDTVHYWNIYAGSLGSLIFTTAQEMLHKIIGEYHNRRITFKFKNFESYSSFCVSGVNELPIILTIDGKVYNDKAIKIIALSTYFDLLFKVLKFFSKQYDWKMTNHHTGADVLKVAKNKFKEEFHNDAFNFNRICFKLKYPNLYNEKNHIIESTWPFTVIIDTEIVENELELKLIRIKSIDIEKVFEDIKRYFNKVFNFSEHKLTILNTREDVKNLVQHLIRNKFIDTFQLHMKGINNRLHIVNNSPEVPTGDWFEFTITVYSKKFNFKFKIRNVATSIENGLVLKILEQFEKDFDYYEHHLSVRNTVWDAASFVIDLIHATNPDIQFSVTSSDERTSSSLLVSSSKSILTGDCVDFTIVIYGQTIKIHFKAKNIARNRNHGKILLIQKHFDKQFEFYEHKLSVKNTRQDASMFVYSLIYKNFCINFQLRMLGQQSSTNFICNNSEKVKYGDWFDFEVKIGDETGRFCFMIKNVSADESGFLISNIKLFFTKKFEFSEHQLTTQNTRQDAYNLVARWIRTELYINNFQLKQLGATSLDNRLVNNSREVKNGDWIHYEVSIGGQNGQFRLQIKDVNSE